MGSSFDSSDQEITGLLTCYVEQILSDIKVNWSVNVILFFIHILAFYDRTK